MQDETVWLTQEQMSELFEKAKSTINEHIRNIYKEGELIERETMTKFGSLLNCIKFRIWATKILNRIKKK